MTFHDNRGMYDAIAKWVESQDVEVSWEDLMNCKWWVGPKDWVPPPKWSQPAPFPRQLSTLLVTKLIFAQEQTGLTIPNGLTNPADIELGALDLTKKEGHPPLRGEGGIDRGLAADEPTDLPSWEKFLGQLANLVIQKVSLYVISEEDRKRLVRMAFLEEELERREVERNRERVNRQNRGEAVSYMSRKRLPGLIDRANKGSLESIAELERRGWDSEEISEWRRKAILKADRARELARLRGFGVRKKVEELVKKNDKGKKGAEDSEAVGAGMEGSQLVGGSEEAAEGGGGGILGREGGREVGEARKLGIEREVEVIRIGPNPRILTCRYKELAEERVCRVLVKDSGKFVKGMRFKITEPKEEALYREPWVYDGEYPRFKGRW